MADAPACFQGTIGRVSTVPSRGVVIVAIEAPLEHHGLVARIAVHGQHVAVAAIQSPAKQEPEKRKWAEIPPGSQAAILCEDSEFQKFLNVKTTEEAIQSLYSRFQIASRSEISTNSRISKLWAGMVSDFRAFQQAQP